MNLTYANLTRTYNGKHTLFEAARRLETATVRTDMTFGGPRGFWGGSPILEVHSELGEIIPEVIALTETVDRDIINPVPVLFDLVVQVIEEAWIPDAFHLVFQSSGWDTRIIAAAIKRLVQKNGTDWLGEGLLFLSNRWEATRFLKVMQIMGWPRNQYTAYIEGEANEHFAQHAYDTWRCAPFPRPGNFFWYLQEWAEGKGLIPDENVQAFTGLWANEVWHWFFPECDWLRHARKKYRAHMIASQPIKARWVEYPLVALPILDVLRKARQGELLNNGNALRREVSDFACPEAIRINRRNLSDGSHPISDRLQQELKAHYKQTEYGKWVQWQVPNNSGNATGWGQWSMALLVEKLINEGVRCQSYEKPAPLYGGLL